MVWEDRVNDTWQSYAMSCPEKNVTPGDGEQTLTVWGYVVSLLEHMLNKNAGSSPLLDLLDPLEALSAVFREPLKVAHSVQDLVSALLIPGRPLVPLWSAGVAPCPNDGPPLPRGSTR